MTLEPIKPRRISGPAKEPITLAEAKAQARITTSSEDSLIEGYIAAARIFIESQTGRTIHDTTWEIVMPYFREIWLPRATPLIEILEVVYKDSDGVATVWSDTGYIADTHTEPGRLVLAYNESWPSFTAYPASPIRIQYRAGIAASPDVEAGDEIKYPMKLLVAGMYKNRESELLTSRDGMQYISQRYGVEAFLQDLRVEWPC